MIECPDQKAATFKQIFEEYSADRFGIHHGEYPRGDVTEGGVRNRELYIYAASMPNGGGQTALARRLEKVKGAQIVAASLADGYGRAVAENVLRGVYEKTNREVWKEVSRGDLRLRNDELKVQLIKDELAGNWHPRPRNSTTLFDRPALPMSSNRVPWLRSSRDTTQFEASAMRKSSACVPSSMRSRRHPAVPKSADRVPCLASRRSIPPFNGPRAMPGLGCVTPYMWTICSAALCTSTKRREC
jgi:hypothetical protein